jgi:hypothetical protein
VNANQLFGWRRLYLEGRLEPANRETPGLLAVRVVEGVREAARRRNASAASGTIQIELPKGRVRIVEIVDQTSLHTVLELCFAKILCAPKIARFPAATAVPFSSSLHPRAPRFSPGGTARAAYLSI